MVIVSIHALNAMEKMYVNIINYITNVLHATDVLYVSIVDEKLHVSSAMEAIFAPMNNKRINVSHVLHQADVNTVKQCLSLDQNGIPIVFVVIVF